MVEPIQRFVLALVILVASGCALQTKIIEERHWQLNDTIRATHIEQLLLNVVRLRYDDTPYFLQVSSISTQFAAQASVGVNGTFPETGRNVYGLSAGAAYSEAPVVTWSMPDSRDFYGRMLAPISADQLTSLASAGWDATRVLLVGVKKMNRLRNKDIRVDEGIYTPPSYDEFREALKLMSDLSREGVIDFAYGVKSSVGAGKIPMEKMDARAIPQGLRQGAIAVASTVGYMPGATAREMFEVQRMGANYGRPTAVHLRYTPGTATTEANGAQEILANAIALGAPAEINHFNNPGWELVQELLARMRARGFNVWGEIYPYAAGQTTINAAFARPENWVDKLGNKYEETMQDPATQEFYTLEKYKKVLAEAPTTQIVLYKMPPDAIADWCRLPGVTYASDGMMMPGGWDDPPTWDTPYDKVPNTHPRLAGTHGTCLRIAREKGIPLMQIIAASSYNPAKYLGATGLKAMQERGRLQKGMVADITIIDPKTVRDNSTYAQGTLPTTGIPYVIVNGTIVVKDSVVLKGVNPGQPIRFPVEAKGRFEPLSREGWVDKNLVAPIGFYGLDDGHSH